MFPCFSTLLSHVKYIFFIYLNISNLGFLQNIFVWLKAQPTALLPVNPTFNTCSGHASLCPPCILLLYLPLPFVFQNRAVFGVLHQNSAFIERYSDFVSNIPILFGSCLLSQLQNLIKRSEILSQNL